MKQNEEMTPISAAPDAENSVQNSVPGKVRRLKAIEPFQFRPGVSGNPGGRPKKDPITYRVRALMEMRVPKLLRLEVEKDLNVGNKPGQEEDLIILSPKFTFADLLVLLGMFAAVGKYTKFNLQIAEWFRMIIEGPITQKIEMGPSADTEEGFQQIKAEVASELFGTLAMRARNLNMAAPKLAELAKKAGITIDVPLVDGEAIEQK